MKPGWIAAAAVAGLAAVSVGILSLNGRPDRELAAAATESENRPALVGQMASFRLDTRPLDPSAVGWRTLDGTQFSLADYSGKIVLLNFWATWCGPVQTRVARINSVAQQLTSDQFAVVAINLDVNPEETAETFAERLELSELDLFVDPEFRSADVMGLRSMPSTFLSM